MNAHTVIAVIGALLGVIVGFVLVQWFLHANLKPIGPPGPSEIDIAWPEMEPPITHEEIEFRMTRLTSDGWVQECELENGELKCVNRYDPDEVKRRTPEEGRLNTGAACLRQPDGDGILCCRSEQVVAYDEEMNKFVCVSNPSDQQRVAPGEGK